MSQVRKTIDDADRTLTTLVGTERFIVRDSSGDAKVEASALSTLAGGRPVGELMFLERYEAISSTFPWKNLADADAELDEANFPDYVPVMRDIPFYRTFSTGSNIDRYFVVAYSIVSNVVTLTLLTNATYLFTLNSLSEMLLDYTDGASPTSTDYTNFNLCLNLFATVGPIPPGDYTVTNINPAAYQISFNYVTPDASDSGLSILSTKFYPYRVPGDSTKCRHRQQLGKSIMTPDFETFFNGVSWRDHMQGWQLTTDRLGITYYGWGEGASSKPSTTAAANNSLPLLDSTKQGDSYRMKAGNDGTNGAPRTDTQTYPSGLGAFLYRYVGRYIAP